LQNLADLPPGTALGLPVIAEMLVKPKEGETTSAKDIGFAMRIGAELGADVIKASFIRPVDAYRSALKACYRPVVVLGGEKTKNEMEMFQAIADALEAGATGVAIGRNVWQHANPAGVCRALVELVHGSGQVAKALKEIKADMKDLLLGFGYWYIQRKGGLFDQGGQLLAKASAPLVLYSPEPGWAEQDPLDW